MSAGGGSGGEAPRGLATMSSAVAGADRYNRWLLSRFRPHLGERLLEVGTGFGNFKRYLPQTARCISIDLDPEVVRRARAGDPAGTYLEGDIADPEVAAALAPRRLDTVLCLNVLEHVADHERALANMLGLLVPGGRLLLLVPACPALYGDLDRLAGHHRRYRRRDLARLAAALPCRVRLLEHFNPLGGLGWWLNRFRRHRDLDSRGVNRQIVLFDRFLVPLSRALDPLTRNIFGQSLICVLEKAP